MTWEEQSRPLQEIMECFARIKKDVFFVQIGCCDGVVEDIMHDLIIKYDWSGILIEPVKYLFDRLKSNYDGCSNLIFRNVAISDKDGFRDFLYVRNNNDGLPFWYDQIGSFFPEVVWKHGIEIQNLSDYLVQEKVECVTLKTLLEQHDVRQIDVMHIDTEGFDFSIIKQIDFEKFKPSIIKYEHKHLIEIDQWDSWNYLKEKGYFVFHNYMDSMAFIGNFVDPTIIEKIKHSSLFFL
jgi:FkbM family methyltransferase